MPKIYVTVSIKYPPAIGKLFYHKVWMMMDIIGGFPPLPSLEELISKENLSPIHKNLYILYFSHPLNIYISSLDGKNIIKKSIPLVAYSSEDLGTFSKRVKDSHIHYYIGIPFKKGKNKNMDIPYYIFNDMIYKEISSYPIFSPCEWSLLASIFLWKDKHLIPSLKKAILPLVSHQVQDILSQYNMNINSDKWEVTYYHENIFPSFKISFKGNYAGKLFSPMTFIRNMNLLKG